MARSQNPTTPRTTDEPWLEACDRSRDRLFQSIAHQNPTLCRPEVLVAAQRTTEWLLFLCLCEARRAQRPGNLRALIHSGNVYPRLCSGRGSLEPSLVLDDAALEDALAPLADGHRSFAASPPIDLLGQFYERSLDHGTPRARKASGVYYTPDYVVRYIVESTVGALVAGRTPAELPRLTVLDPACGAGTFLLGACRLLFDWYRAWYLGQGPEPHQHPALFLDRDGSFRLSTGARREIV